MWQIESVRENDNLDVNIFVSIEMYMFFFVWTLPAQVYLIWCWGLYKIFFSFFKDRIFILI